MILFRHKTRNEISYAATTLHTNHLTLMIIWRQWPKFVCRWS